VSGRHHLCRSRLHLLVDEHVPNSGTEHLQPQRRAHASHWNADDKARPDRGDFVLAREDFAPETPSFGKDNVM
jgi:hypothetical protein